MKVAVYTFTRDRLEYTKRAFDSLQTKADHPFDHYVLDNGSEDGTAEWLSSYGAHWSRFEPINIGIAKASNLVLDVIRPLGYDLVVKFDNDCLVKSDRILSEICDLFACLNGPLSGSYLLSPRVEGLNHPPTRFGTHATCRHEIGFTHIIGGLFQCMAGYIYKHFDGYPVEKLPRGGGCDSYVAHWFRKYGGLIGYIEDLVVEHMDTTNGQARRYPEYFERKRREWQEDAVR